jgi:hypothetical protein
LPNEEVTPPVTKIYLAIVKNYAFMVERYSLFFWETGGKIAFHIVASRHSRVVHNLAKQFNK